MNSFSEWLHPGCVPEAERIAFQRELMSYAMLCPHSSTFESNGALAWAAPQHWSRRLEWPWVVSQANLKSNKAILDIGGCWSVVEYVMAKRAGWVYSLENDPEALAKGEESAKKLGFKNISHIHGDARNLTLLDNLFDVVTCISVLEHVPDNHAKCVSEMLRVLRPGGVALITLDVKLSGRRSDNSFIDLANVGELGLPAPRNEITMRGSVAGEDGNPLNFTVLLSRITKR